MSGEVQETRRSSQASIQSSVPGGKARKPVEVMDRFQREVIRRKRPILADLLDFGPESQEQYKQMKLLKDNMLTSIMTEQTDFGRTFKWLELVGQGPVEGFDRLCDVVSDRGYSWLSDELYVDLLAERGDLEVEEYVYRECGAICHKYFGRSKRVSETDKKEIQTILAMRYQSAKEAWRRQLEKSEKVKQEAIDARNRENGQLRDLVIRIQAFMLVEKPRISQYGHDMITPGELTKDTDIEKDKHDYFKLADESVENTLKLISSFLFERELRDEERGRCLKILNINKPMVELDIVLESALQRAAEDIVRSKQEADTSDKVSKTLDVKLKSLKRETDIELHEKEKLILQLEQVIRNRDMRITELESMISDHKQQIMDLEDEVEKWKKRCEMIEKTRRLGYYYPGWADKMNADIDSIDYRREPKGSYNKNGMYTLSTPKRIMSARSPRRITLTRKYIYGSGRESASSGSTTPSADKDSPRHTQIIYESAYNVA